MNVQVIKRQSNVSLCNPACDLTGTPESEMNMNAAQWDTE